MRWHSDCKPDFTKWGNNNHLNGLNAIIILLIIKMENISNILTFNKAAVIFVGHAGYNF